jgi:hypothetical protein
MNEHQAAKLIEVLEKFSRRPHMFLGKSDVLLAQVFFSGFRCAFDRLVGLQASVEGQVIRDRGWTIPGATGSIAHQMSAKGMDEEQIIRELTAIEIEIVKRAT